MFFGHLHMNVGGKRLAGGRGALEVFDWGLSSRLNQDVKPAADLSADGADCLSNRMFHAVCFKKYKDFFKACSEQIGASVVAMRQGGGRRPHRTAAGSASLVQLGETHWRNRGRRGFVINWNLVMGGKGGEGGGGEETFLKTIF